jgi:hypothetical protein
VAGRDDLSRDLGSLVVPAAGSLAETGDPWEPYRLTGADGARVEAVSEFLRDLQAAGRPATTQRSYGLALLRWFRFTWAVDVPWDQATRTEARDFCRWVQLAGKPGGARAAAVTVPGRRPASAKYASSTVAHCETVCRGFYSYHVEAGTGPLVNPFPLARPGRANAHHNPVDPFGGQRAGLFRPRVPRRLPRQIPDEVFNELFARLGSHRDRALPASPDAFVWLRLYQQQMRALVLAGPDDPLWWTLRRPFRPLGYHAARAMFVRANDAVGTGWTLHDLRHTAAYRLARDPAVPITDVQWVLGHQSLSTTQLYVTPAAEDVIESTLAHHRRQAEPKPAQSPEPGLRYRPESLDVLFGRERP